MSRDSFFHFFVEGAAGGAGVRVSVGEDGEEGGAVMDEDGQVCFGSIMIVLNCRIDCCMNRCKWASR